MAFILSKGTESVNLTDMGIQNYSVEHPVRTAELELTDGMWSLQQRGLKAPRYRFAGNFRPAGAAGGSGRAEYETLLAGRTAEWTLSQTEVGIVDDDLITGEVITGIVERTIGVGYIQRDITVESADLLNGEPLLERWRFSFLIKPPTVRTSSSPATAGDLPPANNGVSGGPEVDVTGEIVA